MFIKKTRSFIIIILIYVDDILIAGPDNVELESFIVEFSKVFALKDFGNSLIFWA